MGPGSSSAQVAVYYRFRDASGRVHVVDSIDSVPQALRTHAQRIEYQTSRERSLAAPGSYLPRELSTWQSFALGVVAALALVFLFKLLPGTMRLVLRVAVILGVVALLGGAYLGWMRRATTQSKDVFATPTALIDDAKGAVAKMNARMQAEQAELKEAEQAK